MVNSAWTGLYDVVWLGGCSPLHPRHEPRLSNRPRNQTYPYRWFVSMAVLTQAFPIGSGSPVMLWPAFTICEWIVLWFEKMQPTMSMFMGLYGILWMHFLDMIDLTSNRGDVVSRSKTGKNCTVHQWLYAHHPSSFDHREGWGTITCQGYTKIIGNHGNQTMTHHTIKQCI